jgi:hypothetical protein
MIGYETSACLPVGMKYPNARPFRSDGACLGDSWFQEIFYLLSILLCNIKKMGE